MRCLLLLVPLLGCAETPAPATVPTPALPPPAPAPVAGAPPPRDAGTADSGAGPTIHAVEPDATMEIKHRTEKQWLAEMREKLGQELKADPAELRFSPDKQWVVIVRGPPPPPEGKPVKHPRRYQILVTDSAGKRRLQFRPVTLKGSDEPPKDVHFLADDRLAYEVVESPPPPPPPPGAKVKGKKPVKPAKPAKTPPKPVVKAPPKPEGPPKRLFVIQPLTKRGRPVRCQGVHFTFPVQQDHLAYLGGEPDAGFVAVDGVQVYPRKGRALIASEPAWSKDGHSVAFLELRPRAPARLVLLAEYDNPTGDTTWDLPASAVPEGAKVFWAGSGKLVVGKSSMRPIFAASFYKEKPPPAWREP